MKRLTLLVLFLMLMPFAQDAVAATITFQVDYTTLYYRLCQGHAGCFDLSPPPFSRTFTLDSSQLATDGIYDVSSSLTDLPLPDPQTVAYLFLASAAVANQQVTGLSVQFYQKREYQINPFGQFTNSIQFVQENGDWYRNQVGTDPLLGGNSSFSFGTYTIQQLPVPEPATIFLLGAGLLTLLMRRPS
jgi:hypothetical protein